MTRRFAIPFGVIISLSALTFAHVALLLRARLYPFVDNAFHLAAATIVRYYNSDQNRFAEFFKIDLFPKPNVFHTLFCAYMPFLSVEAAHRIFYCIYAIFLVVMMVMIIRRLGGDLWFAVLTPLALYAYAVRWGFVGFTFGVPLVLLVFYLTLDVLEKDRFPTKVALASVFLCLFFVHVLALLFGLLVYFAFGVWRFRSTPRSLLRWSLVVLPVVLMVFVWLLHESGFKESSEWRVYGPEEFKDTNLVTFLWHYYTQVYAPSFLSRRQVMYYDNSHLGRAPWGDLVATAFFLFVAWPTISWTFSKIFRREKRTINGLDKLLPFVLCALGCCLLLPNALPGEPVLYERFTIYLLLSLIMLGSLVRKEKPGFSRQLTIVVVAFIHLAATSSYLSEFEAESADFTPEFLAGNPRHQRLAAMIYDFTTPRGEVPYVRFSDYYTVWHQGIACTNLVDFRFGVVHRRLGPAKLPIYDEWVGASDMPDRRYAQAAIERLLVRGEPSWRAEECLQGYKVIRQRGIWKLYEWQGSGDAGPLAGN